MSFITPSHNKMSIQPPNAPIIRRHISHSDLYETDTSNCVSFNDIISYSNVINFDNISYNEDSRRIIFDNIIRSSIGDHSIANRIIKRLNMVVDQNEPHWQGYFSKYHIITENANQIQLIEFKKLLIDLIMNKATCPISLLPYKINLILYKMKPLLLEMSNTNRAYCFAMIFILMSYIKTVQMSDERSRVLFHYLHDEYMNKMFPNTCADLFPFISDIDVYPLFGYDYKMMSMIDNVFIDHIKTDNLSLRKAYCNIQIKTTITKIKNISHNIYNMFNAYSLQGKDVITGLATGELFDDETTKTSIISDWAKLVNRIIYYRKHLNEIDNVNDFNFIFPIIDINTTIMTSSMAELIGIAILVDSLPKYTCYHRFDKKLNVLDHFASIMYSVYLFDDIETEFRKIYDSVYDFSDKYRGKYQITFMIVSNHCDDMLFNMMPTEFSLMYQNQLELYSSINITPHLSCLNDVKQYCYKYLVDDIQYKNISSYYYIQEILTGTHAVKLLLSPEDFAHDLNPVTYYLTKVISDIYSHVDYSIDKIKENEFEDLVDHDYTVLVTDFY